jgi:S1-C subfamily serine protease
VASVAVVCALLARHAGDGRQCGAADAEIAASAVRRCARVRRPDIDGSGTNSIAMTRHITVLRGDARRRRPRATLPALLLAAATLQAAMPAHAVAPRLEVYARAAEDGRQDERAVAPGALLRSGDEVRLEVTVWEDAHLYVVALGSSGRAVLLHPLSVDNAGAGVRAGETVAIPRDGGFVPLDGRTGQESLFAFTTGEPLATIPTLLTRVEARAGDRAAARATLRESGFDAAHLTFGHVGPERPALQTRPAFGDGAAAEDAPATVVPSREPGVLGGLGSRIAIFTDEVLVSPPPAATADPRSVRAPAPVEQPEVHAEAAADPGPQHPSESTSGPGGGPLARLARLLGFGGDGEVSNPAQEHQGAEARTFPMAPTQGAAPSRGLPSPDPGSRVVAATPPEVATTPAVVTPDRSRARPAGAPARVAPSLAGEAAPITIEAFPPPPVATEAAVPVPAPSAIKPAMPPSPPLAEHPKAGDARASMATVGRPPNPGLASSSPAQPVAVLEPRVSALPAPVPQRVADASGRDVVVLQGSSAPPEAGSEVLSASGSTIRAFLDESDGASAAVEGEAPSRAPSEAAAALPQVTERAVERLAQLDLEGAEGPAAAVVLVVTPQGMSSGVLLDAEGHLLTSWHGVRGHDVVVVYFKSGSGPRPGRATRARVLGHSKFSDLALLRTEDAPPVVAIPPLPAEVRVQEGARVHAIGHGAGAGWQHELVTVERVRPGSSWYSQGRVLHHGDVIRGSLPQAAELSGALLFSDRMELLGLAATVRSDKQELIGVSSDTIRAFLGPPD